MIVSAIFPTFIYEHQGTHLETFLIQKEIKEKLPIIEQTDKFENPIGWNDGVQTNIKQRHNTIKDFELNNLKKYIDLHVAKYIELTKAHNPVPVFLRHSWINKTYKDQGQEFHQHQDSLISGTYYYQTNGNDGNLGFMNPVPWMQQELFPFGGIAEKYHNIKPSIGKLVLFPGWLLHSVDKNSYEEPRISISFNYHRDYFRRTGILHD